MIKNIPYWSSNVERLRYKSIPVKSDCDAVIIGAGYTGLSTAIKLAKAGKFVQVFDVAQVGSGASSLNAGILSGNLRFSLKSLIESKGMKAGTEYYIEGINARKELQEFIKQECIECDLKYNGHFTGAMTIKDFDQMKYLADFERKILSNDIQILNRYDQHKVIQSEIYHGGTLRNDIGNINPVKFLDGLLRVAISYGAVIHENTAIHNIIDHRNVNTAAGHVKCDKIVVATNAYDKTNNKWFRKIIIPITSRIIATEPISPEIMVKLMPRMGSFGEGKYMGKYYRPSPDGKRILLGGRDVLVGKNPYGAAKSLSNSLVKIFPELNNVKVEYHWAGKVGFTRKQMPSIFEKDGILYACGYCGSGTVWAPWIGTKVAQKVLKKHTQKTIFYSEPPQKIPLFNGRPWFLPFVIIWYSTLDWIKGR